MKDYCNQTLSNNDVCVLGTTLCYAGGLVFVKVSDETSLKGNIQVREFNPTTKDFTRKKYRVDPIRLLKLDEDMAYKKIDELMARYRKITGTDE